MLNGENNGNRNNLHSLQYGKFSVSRSRKVNFQCYCGIEESMYFFIYPYIYLSFYIPTYLAVHLSIFTFAKREGNVLIRVYLFIYWFVC